MAKPARGLKQAIKRLVQRAADTDGVRALAEETSAAFWSTLPAVTDLQTRADELGSQLVRLEEDTKSQADWVKDFGAAVSREHGADGAPNAYRELAYLVGELRREVRDLKAILDGDAGVAQSVEPASQHTESQKQDRFDYVGFERRFRGDPTDLEPVLVDRWRDDLVGAGGLIVDIGCGRGELLGALAREGAEVLGVEPNPELAAQTRSRGVECVEQYADEYLRSVADQSIGAIVMLHVAEHLPVQVLIEVLELAAVKLKPGGVFVAETPNPATVLTMHESYILDPTHVQPLHPALFSFLAESAGLSDIEVRYFSPASTLWLEPLDSDAASAPVIERFNALVERLNHQLYGPQDFALVARGPQQRDD